MARPRVKISRDYIQILVGDGRVIDILWPGESIQIATWFDEVIRVPLEDECGRKNMEVWATLMKALDDPDIKREFVRTGLKLMIQKVLDARKTMTT